jgi:hypothetical protein
VQRSEEIDSLFKNRIGYPAFNLARLSNLSYSSGVERWEIVPAWMMNRQVFISIADAIVLGRE